MSGSLRRDDATGRWRVVGLLTVLSILLLMPTVVIAQRDFSKVEIKTTNLGDGLAMLQGAGGNIGVSTGKDGVFLIDDQYAPLTEKILKAVRALSKDEVRFVFNTHWHGDHTGGNENLGQAGALIFAHERVRARVSVDQVRPLDGRKTPASPEAAWPVVTFEDGVTLHLNGQTIEATHVESAHTDGDSIVYFHQADLLHMGDTFFAGMYPFIDTSSGGAIDGMIAAADRGLAIAGPETRIIPGHGPLSNRADLEVTRNMLVSIRDRVLKLIEDGQNRDQVIAAKPTKEHDEKWGGGFIKPDVFAGIVYDGLEGRTTK
jgi:cyclase